jgi:hypothetical protein
VLAKAREVHIEEPRSKLQGMRSLLRFKLSKAEAESETALPLLCQYLVVAL